MNHPNFFHMNISVIALMVIFFVTLFLGWMICWLWSRARHQADMSRLRESVAGQLAASQQDLTLAKATSAEQLQALRRDIDRIQEEKAAFGHQLAGQAL